MSLVKSKLRNKMGNGLLDDCLVTYIEGDAFSKVNEDDIIETFMRIPANQATITDDFCVADLTRDDTPAGYPCKRAAEVTSDDFYYHGLATPAPPTPSSGVGLGTALVQNYTALNGMHLSALRLDFAAWRSTTTRSANEIIFVIDGDVYVGFISSSSNVPYTKTLHKGDIFLFPQGLLHFLINVGKKPAEVFCGFSNQNPGIQITEYALFGNDLPADVVEKVTYLDDAEVKRLKAFFGRNSI